MTDPEAPPVPAPAPVPSPAPRRFPWELLFPLGLLGWRLGAYPIATLWRDWVVWISLYWIFTIFARRSKAWAPVTVLVTIALLGIYLSRQLPHTLDTLRFAW
ncbi:MAG TPA: hypothetical protein VJB14_07790 [Planctomycetota bacterium]|nr:hypothetical protein [Planctomycetota bacterium]